LEERGNCPACNHDPVTGEEAGNTLVKVRKKVRKPGSHHHQHPRQSRERSSHGRKKARYLVYFVFGWVAVVGGWAVMSKRAWQNKVPVPSPDYVAKSVELTEDEVRLLQENLKKAADHLAEFLRAPDVGSRALHVLRPEQTVPRMGRYYDRNPQAPLQGGTSLILQNVMHTPAGPAIETLWQRENGDVLEAVFFEEKSDWKLDWDAFTRAGTESWGLFLAGTGDGEGTFRVLARERIGAGGRNDESIGLVLYEPRPGHPDEATLPSPEIRVTRATALGRAIQEAFDAKAKKLSAFHGKSDARDPAEMVRLNVRIRRSGTSERVFQIEELLAAHWLEIPGTPVKAGQP
jgi:hypothetical protein